MFFVEEYVIFKCSARTTTLRVRDSGQSVNDVRRGKTSVLKTKHIPRVYIVFHNFRVHNDFRNNLMKLWDEVVKRPYYVAEILSY